MKSQQKMRVWVAILIPLMLAILVSWLQTSNLIDGLVATSERTETERTEKLVHSAFSSYKTSFAAYANDNGDWNEAARNTYPERNRDWFELTFKNYGTNPDPIYNVFALVNGNTSQVEFYFSHSSGQNIDITDLFGSDWSKIVASLPEEVNAPDAITSFVKTPKGDAIVAVSPIVTSIRALETTNSRPHYLVFLRYVDQPLLSRLSKQYAIDGLALAAPSMDGRKGIELKDEISLHSLSLSWTVGSLDSRVQWELWSHALVTLAITLIVLSGIAISNLRLLLDMQRRENQAVFDSSHDSLTGLGNRSAFTQYIEEFKNGAVLFADLDGFKGINDNFGHKTGDVLLTKVATIIAELAAEAGKSFRLGGDEFVVLFSGENQKQSAVCFAEKLIERLKNPMDLGEIKVHCGISIGISLANENSAGGKTCVQEADQAMYMAKNAGRNCLVVFGQNDASVEKLKLASKKLKQNMEQIQRRSFRNAVT